MSLEIEVLPFQLQIITINRAHVEQCTHSALKAMLETYRSGGLFSYAITPREITIITTAEQVAHFPSELIKASPMNWRALQISPGESGTANISKTINEVAVRLGHRGISIFQLSSVIADFTFVKETDMNSALDVLSNQHLEKLPDNANFDVKGLNHNVTFYDDISLHVAAFRETSLFNHLFPHILELMFFRAHSVFSITIFDQEVSFILDEKASEAFPPDTINILDNFTWRCFEISEPSGLGFDEPGIVAYYTSALSRYDMNCFYLSTFQSDFLLVESEKYPKAKRIFGELTI